MVRSHFCIKEPYTANKSLEPATLTIFTMTSKSSVSTDNEHRSVLCNSVTTLVVQSVVHYLAKRFTFFFF